MIAGVFADSKSIVVEKEVLAKYKVYITQNIKDKVFFYLDTLAEMDQLDSKIQTHVPIPYYLYL
jgi:hypothetical protein